MKKYFAVLLSLVALAILCGSATAVASVSVGASSTPQASSSNVFPINGFYVYTITDGGSVTDNIPVQFCVTGEENSTWTSFQVQIGNQGNGGNLTGVALPGNVTFFGSETVPLCKNAAIQINTGPLTLTDPQTAQEFVKNINIR